VTVEAAVEAEIRRLYYAEHWHIGTIAAQLGVCRTSVCPVIRDVVMPQ